jgi:hypothetical protein
MDSLQGSGWLVGGKGVRQSDGSRSCSLGRFLFTHLFVLFFDFLARVNYLVSEPFVDVCR